MSDSCFDDELEDFSPKKKSAEHEHIDPLNWWPVWVDLFLQHHTRDHPVGFVSCHSYMTDWALDTGGNMSKRVREMQAFGKDLALSSSPSSRDHVHDGVPAAIYIARTMFGSLKLVNTIAYWTFTHVFEEDGAGLTPFWDLQARISCLPHSA
ncbi:hypothetical protein BKA56DRAFT_674364 [Ilyonectria sp. MPI-CAGE-AT-0026]|nr:hypothetical protein BKA56DRAFT_674364 [Ilyonectria sp. MPI-CAGE-AT-0026]